MKISDKLVSSSVCGVADADAAADDAEGCGVADADAARGESCDGEFNAVNRYRVIAGPRPNTCCSSSNAAAAMGCCGEAVSDSTRL